MLSKLIDKFVAKYNNKSIDVDGFPKEQPYQCWDEAEQYCREVLKIPANPFALPTGDGTAYGSYETKPDPISKYFDRKVRKRVGPFIINSRPQKGDLVYWHRELPGSGNAGHVDLCISDISQNKHGFLGFDQNWSGNTCKRVNHNYTYVAGYLRPKVNVK